MRTTINVDDDVATEVQRLRQEAGLGLSEALNYLARRGMSTAPESHKPFRQRSVPMGARVDVSNTADLLELIELEDDT